MTAASSVAVPALRRTVALRKSPNRTGGQSSSAWSRPRTPSVPSTMMSASRASSERTLLGPHADPHGGPEAIALDELGEAAERVEVGGVVADVERDGEVAVAQQVDDPGALVDPHRRPDLEHLAAPVGGEARPLGGRRDVLDRRLRLLLVGHAAPVQRRDRLLVLQPHAQLAQILGEVLVGEVLDAARPRLQLAVELGGDRARHQHLRAVRAQVGDRAERDDPAGVGGAPAGHAGDHAVAARDLDQRPPGALGHVRVVGVQNDRRQHAVDVEQDGGALRVGLQWPQQLLEGSRWTRHRD